jgi:hypothetical protein
MFAQGGVPMYLWPGGLQLHPIHAAPEQGSAMKCLTVPYRSQLSETLLQPGWLGAHMRWGGDDRKGSLVISSGENGSPDSDHGRWSQDWPPSAVELQPAAFVVRSLQPTATSSTCPSSWVSRTIPLERSSSS